MTVIVLDRAPEVVRGELTRWFLELNPGVFAGKVNVRIRELLWQRIVQLSDTAGAVMLYSTPTEQGFEMRLHGEPKRKVVNIEGVELIKVVES